MTESLDNVLVKAALEDLAERLTLIQEVLVPDYLDTLRDPDWDLLVDLRTLARTLNAIALQVATLNRVKIVDGWVGGPPQNPPPSGPESSLPGARG